MVFSLCLRSHIAKTLVTPGSKPLVFEQNGARIGVLVCEDLWRAVDARSARRYREDELRAYDPPLLREFLSEVRVLRRPDAPWGRTLSDPAVERVMSLLAASSATHLIVLSHDPIDVIALAVPVISADPATETALALVRRLLALTPEAI